MPEPSPIEPTKEVKWWRPAPVRGDVCWAINFPTNRHGHKPKNRPCLIVNISSNAEQTKWRVLAVYATTNTTDNSARAYQFVVGTEDRQVFINTGLQSDTKFDLNDCAWMDYNDEHFGIAPFGPTNTPRIGFLDTAGTKAGERYRNAKSVAKTYPPLTTVEMKTPAAEPEKKKDP